MSTHRSRHLRKDRRDSRRLLLALTLALSLGACTTNGSLRRHQTFEPDRAAHPAHLATSDAGVALDGPMLQTVRVSERSAPYRRLAPAPPPGLLESSPLDLGHPAVDPFVDYYADQSPEIIARSLLRAYPLLPRMRELLSQAGVPEELVYLPIVESHFKADARSGAGATGIWQLMGPTARHYGLRIDRCVDERRDPLRATEAAARYLSTLHARFEDWHLALAAYNIGEGRIYRIMRDNDIDDYWTMVDRALLPRETAQFVPKFMAAATVADDPQTFGITPEEVSGLNQDFVEVRVSDPLSLRTVASLAGIERARLEALNPALACGRIPVGGYDVRLPRRALRPFKQAYAELDRRTLGDSGTHRVARGESPATIARKYGISVRALMRENGIHNPRRLRVNTTLRIPNPT